MKAQFRSVFFYALLCFLLLMFSKSEEVASSAIESFDFLVHTLFPALFPYLFFGALFGEISAGARINRGLAQLIKRSLHLPPEAAKCLFVSALCGFPSGAMSVAAAYRRNELSQADARRLFCFAQIPSPAFCISFLGNTVFHSKFHGLYIYLACLFSAYIYGHFTGKKTSVLLRDTYQTTAQTVPVSKAFSIATRRSLGAFGTLSVSLVALRIFWIFLSRLLHLLKVPDGIRTVLYGFLDAAGGCVDLAKLPFMVSIGCATVILSFLGIGIYLQIHPYASEIGLLKRSFWLSRLIQAAFSLGFVIFFCNFHDFFSHMLL